MSPPPPPPPLPATWTFRGLIGRGLIFAVGLVAGWLTDETLKPPVMRFFDSLAEQYIPWDSKLVQAIWPNALTFEASEFSGCSGGELARLVSQSKSQGLRFDNDTQVSNALLCRQWTYHGSAQSILRSMAVKFPECFAIDQVGTFSVRLNARFVCKTDYGLNPNTNNWERTSGAVTLLCLPRAVKTPMTSTEPPAHGCPDDELKKLQFVR